MQGSKLGTIDLSPQDLATINEILGHYLKEHEVFVFGSRATGKSASTCDLDLLVKGKEPLDLAIKGNLLYDLQESEMYPRVDLVDWWSTDETFRWAIEPNCKLIYKPSTEPVQ